MEAEPQPAEGEAVPCPRLHGIRDMRMGTSVFRAPAPGEVLLRIGAVGLCGSDVHYFTHWDKMDGGLATLSERGQIIGHEFSGTVAALGEGVAEAWPELTVGTRVAGERSSVRSLLLALMGLLLCCAQWSPTSTASTASPARSATPTCATT